MKQIIILPFIILIFLSGCVNNTSGEYVCSDGKLVNQKSDCESIISVINISDYNKNGYVDTIEAKNVLSQYYSFIDGSNGFENLVYSLEKRQELTTGHKKRVLSLSLEGFKIIKEVSNSFIENCNKKLSETNCDKMYSEWINPFISSSGVTSNAQIKEIELFSLSEEEIILKTKIKYEITGYKNEGTKYKEMYYRLTLDNLKWKMEDFGENVEFDNDKEIEKAQLDLNEYLNFSKEIELLIDMTTKDSCWLKENNNDLNLCYESNFINLAIDKNDITMCDSIIDKESIAKCYFMYLVTYDKEPSFCLKIPKRPIVKLFWMESTTPQDKCLFAYVKLNYEIGLAINNQVCKDITDTELKNNCENMLSS